MRIDNRRRSRSLFLSVMSICGSIAAMLWLFGPDLASAEPTAQAPTQTQTQLKSTDQKSGTATPVKPKKKSLLTRIRSSAGSFEGY